DDRGRLTMIHGASGPVLVLEHDGAHNVVAETDARGGRTLYAYDAMGRPVTRTDPLGRTTRVSYDRLGRIIAVRYPDGTATSSAHDPLGNVARHVDALGQVTTMEYGGTGMPSKLVRPDGSTWSFAYTGTERLREVKNPHGETYEFTHDEAGRIIAEKTFDGRVLDYAYADDGRLARVRYPDQGWRAFAYDRLGNVVEDRTADATTTYQHDALGLLLAATLTSHRPAEGERPAVTTFERDPFGRIIAEAHGDRRLVLEYDAESRRTLRILPDGARTRYAYDAAGALVLVEHDGHALVIERDLAGREVRRGDREGRLDIRSSYDAMDRLVEQRASLPSPGGGAPTILAQRGWQYDATGRVRQLDDARWGSTKYGYDRVDQLLSTRRGGLAEAFEYDAVGSLVNALERLEGPRARPAWEMRPGGLLARTPEAKYTYDARGRRTVKLALGGGAAPGEARATEYAWDDRDRLREVRLPSGDRVLFTYDAFGRRLQKRVIADDAQRTIRAVDFVWDGHVLAAEVDSSRGARCFVHEPGSFVVLLQQEQKEIFTYVNDHLGMPRELIGASGLIAWSASHSTWGKVLDTYRDPLDNPRRGRRVDTPFRLLGQYADDETGLAYTRFRYFDPDVGRWCSPDPLGLAGGRNLFAFNGSPTLVVDPLGLACRGEAFGQAKQDAGIPRSQGPDRHERVPMTDRNGRQIFDANHQPVMTTEYHYTRADGSRIVIQDHSAGHQFGEGGVGDQGPHFNVRPASDTRNGQVPGCQEHYPFTP
ncbi:MAG: HNH/endonuclease VII fold putative polymorphic toxin, partial [Byssovorax sp.]